MEACNKEIFESGSVVGIYAIKKDVMEAAVVDATKALGFKVDWHFAAGRNVVKTLGDVDLVRKHLQDLNIFD